MHVPIKGFFSRTVFLGLRKAQNLTVPLERKGIDRHHGCPHGGYGLVSIVHRGERLDGSTHLQDAIVLGVAVRMLESPLIAAQHAE